jgi:hypothetical protein
VFFDQVLTKTGMIVGGDQKPSAAEHPRLTRRVFHYVAVVFAREYQTGILIKLTNISEIINRIFFQIMIRNNTIIFYCNNIIIFILKIQIFLFQLYNYFYFNNIIIFITIIKLFLFE